MSPYEGYDQGDAWEREHERLEAQPREEDDRLYDPEWPDNHTDTLAFD